MVDKGRLLEYEQREKNIDIAEKDMGTRMTFQEDIR